MEALVWLAIPFVVTAIAAVVLQVRARRAEQAASDDAAQRRRLTRIERALREPPAAIGEPHPAMPTAQEGPARTGAAGQPWEPGPPHSDFKSARGSQTAGGHA